MSEQVGKSFTRMVREALLKVEEMHKEKKGEMAKAIGIKLGQHANYNDCKNKIYYYLALEDFAVGDTAVVILPGGQMVGVPVVQVLEAEDGKVGGIDITKYAVCKVDDSKYRELNRVKDDIKAKRKAMQRAGYEVRKRIRYIANQKTWADWAQVDIGVLTLIGDYYLAKEKYAEVAGVEEAESLDAAAHGKEVIYESELPY